MSTLRVNDLCMKVGEGPKARVIQEGVNFEIQQGSIFAIMGSSGCGKSTLLRHLVGLAKPAAGQVLYDDEDFWSLDEAGQQRWRARFGMLFQSAALWTSMSVLDNVCVPLQIKENLSRDQCRDRALELLSWVGMKDAADRMPSDLSGGMKKRAGLARAIAGEPAFLFLDEPSAGLDPINSKRLDLLILEIRERTGAAILMVSHELPSLFAIADDGIFLDADSHRPLGRGSPTELRDHCEHRTVQAFLHREELADET